MGRFARAAAPRLLWFLGSTVLSTGCDLGTKALAEVRLADAPGQAVMIVEPYVEFALAYNRGTAFSFIPDLEAARLVFGVFSLLVALGLFWFVRRSQTPRMESAALGAMAGGAIGNGLGRLFRAAPGGGTGVVDFVKLNYPWGGSWPTFNVADVTLVAGAVVLLFGRALNGNRSSGPRSPENGT